MTGGDVKGRRRYDNAARAEQARATRRRVVDAARRLLVERGYAGTTMSAVAAEAGVSVETVYKAFRSKPALTKAVYDVTLAGDDEPVPLAERPEYRAMLAEPDPRRKLALYAGVARALAERLGPLLAVLVAGARSGDDDLQALVATADDERLAGTTGLVGHLADAGALRPGLEVSRARDALWTLISPDVHRLLVGDRGWSHDEYERWLADTVADALVGPPHVAPGS